LNISLSPENLKTLQDAKDKMETLGFQWEVLQARFAVVYWPNFAPLLDGLSAVANAYTELGKAFNNLPAPIKQYFEFNPLLNPTAILNILGKIPKMAGGGIVSSPTLAMIGEAGPEAVIPLGQLSQGNNEIHTHLYLDGEQIVDVVERRIANRVRATEAPYYG
jgi:hypothetical protein